MNEGRVYQYKEDNIITYWQKKDKNDNDNGVLMECNDDDDIWVRLWRLIILNVQKGT